MKNVETEINEKKILMKFSKSHYKFHGKRAQ